MKKKKELFPFPARTHKEARNLANEWLSKYFDELVESALNHKSTFVYEGHFTNDATWDIPKRFKEMGYTTHLIFFGLSTPQLSEMRVIERSKTGGHYVNPLEVEANFYGNLEKLNQHYEVIDHLQIVDTSEADHIILGQFVYNEVVNCVEHSKLPFWFTQHLPSLAAKIKACT